MDSIIKNKNKQKKKHSKPQGLLLHFEQDIMLCLGFSSVLTELRPQGQVLDYSGVNTVRSAGPFLLHGERCLATSLTLSSCRSQGKSHTLYPPRPGSVGAPERRCHFWNPLGSTVPQGESSCPFSAFKLYTPSPPCALS